MSETCDYYVSWQGCPAFGNMIRPKLKDDEPPVVNPLDISNCAVWFDAANTDSIEIVIGQPNVVGAWTNLGTSGGYAYQDVGDVYTGLQTMNDLNVLDLCGSQLSFNWSKTNETEVTVFVVSQTLSDLSGMALPYINFFDAYSGNYNLGFSSGYDPVNGFFYGIGANNLAVYALTFTPINPIGINTLVCMRTDLSGAANEILLNGENRILDINAPSIYYNPSNFNYLIGKASYGTRFALAEMIIYDRALTDTEVNSLYTYLTAKWKIRPIE